ncbi:MAG: DEAD/DEAH box helicase [Ignavibacteriaceae bacterium]|nr:DEAD/DEAH box helicase [Ignavibacteriaceae bacterium]
MEPKIKLGNEEQKKIFKNLYSYQEDASLFLLENKHGLICEQFGMGKTVEVCAALKVLHETHQLKKVLLIAPEENIGDAALSAATGESIGWLGHLNKWFPDIKINPIKGDCQERSERWQQSGLFYVINYRHLIDDLAKTLSDGNYLSSFDCIIVDEVQYFEKEIYLNRFVRMVNPKNFWFTTSLPYKNVSTIFEFDKKVSVEIDAVLENRYERKKEEVTGSIPDILRQDVWLELDGEQQYEYNAALSNVSTQIGELYSSGNPYRFQAKVFFLLHQLKQICNFVGDNKYSPKVMLLLKHLDLILGSGQKVLIFTQYDKFGTQKIESILQEKGIKYSSYLAGMTVTEMEASILNFRKDKNIPIFLAGLRAAGVRENIAEVPYVIHFDQWWNPITHWQIENRVNHPEDKKIKVTNLNVYNYLVRNTFEEKLKIKLSQKGLLNKNIIESLSAEAVTKLIRDDEWLEMLGIMEKDESRVHATKDAASITTEEKFIEQAKGFFNALGYKNLKVNGAAKNEKVIIQGSSINKNKQINMVAACYFEPDLPATSIKDFIEMIEKIKNVDKIFIIVNGEYKIKSKLTLNNNVTFLDRESFQMYIDQFQIFP